MISHGSVSTLDPVFSLFAVVNYVSKQFYEQLFAWDGDLNAQPQLVDNWSVSDDGLEYTFTVRDSNFHGGDTFGAADAVASITRWRDAGTPAAGIIRRFTDDDAFEVVDRQTFTWTFNEPLGSTIFILGIPHGAMPMMREEDAATPFTMAVDERIGTGPYRFVRWDQGDRVVLERFDDYSSRSEPFQPGGYIGNTVAYIDSLEFLEIPDEETKMAGLETGEWDVIEFAGLDFFSRLNDNPEINVTTYAPGLRSNVYLNPQIPPFSYKRARQALQTGVQIEDFMFALGDPQLWQVCDAVYWCGTPLETHVGSTFEVELSDGPHTIGYNVYDVPVAQQLLAESDYAGETTIILNPTDLAVLTPLGPVLRQFMQEIGVQRRDALAGPGPPSPACSETPTRTAWLPMRSSTTAAASPHPGPPDLGHAGLHHQGLGPRQPPASLRPRAGRDQALGDHRPDPDCPLGEGHLAAAGPVLPDASQHRRAQELAGKGAVPYYAGDLAGAALIAV